MRTSVTLAQSYVFLYNIILKTENDTPTVLPLTLGFTYHNDHFPRLMIVVKWESLSRKSVAELSF